MSTLDTSETNNRMLKIRLWSLLLVLMTISAQLYAAPQKPENTVQSAVPGTAKVKLHGKVMPDKINFAPGEEMTFIISVDSGNQSISRPYYFDWIRTGDDGNTLKGKNEITPGKNVIIKTAMNIPGFVCIKGALVDRQGRSIMGNIKEWGKNVRKPITFNGGAGVAIDKLAQAVPEPDDFDAYWAEQKKLLDAIPLVSRMEKINAPGAKVDIYAVSIDCAGSRPVTGYMTIPAGAKDKSLPATVCYQGYGTNIQSPPSGGSGSMINFTINAHGFDLGKDNAYYDEFFKNIKSNGKSYAFDPIENSKPETAYFNGMALRVMRSLQFVKSLPQWNGTLTVTGGSQGGLQTIWAAGLDHDVTMAVLYIPWCCDLGGSTVGRLRGWCPEWVPALGYFDAVNHAKRIKCPVNITRAGLGDYTCPPSGVTILYNAIKSPKKIHYVQGSTHGVVPENPQTMNLEAK